MRLYNFLTLAFLACYPTTTQVENSTQVGAIVSPPTCPTPVTPIVCFSPNRGGLDCTKMIVNYIDQAKSSIYVQAYNFTSPDIAQALVRARSRGVSVEVLLDRSVPTEKGGQLDTLVKGSVVSLIDSAHAISHNKVMVIDQKIVLTGSFNFTVSAEARNAENMVALTDPILASSYLDNWKFHKQHSK